MGKNTLANCFIKKLNELGISAKSYAFADELKKELNPLFLLNAGISAFTEDPYEKELIRKTLISYGTGYWRQKDPDHWIKRLEETFKSEDDPPQVRIITDLRFASNELPWVKKNGGTVIHLSRYTDNGDLFPFAGEDEMLNDPLIEELADEKIKWNDYHDSVSTCYYKGEQFFNQIFGSRISEWQNASLLAKTI